ncbi:hypothetical protein ACFQ1M_13635 [Sungkyunkwania multivorans]|uniref:Uncharacterized protein n=1 Tax=Sungkyunkwania multivorans TaxID=1173618 RepID=A0ABW3D2H2_9FLAO
MYLQDLMYFLCCITFLINQEPIRLGTDLLEKRVAGKDLSRFNKLQDNEVLKFGIIRKSLISDYYQLKESKASFLGENANNLIIAVENDTITSFQFEITTANLDFFERVKNIYGEPTWTMNHGILPKKIDLQQSSIKELNLSEYNTLNWHLDKVKRYDLFIENYSQENKLVVKFLVYKNLK